MDIGAIEQELFSILLTHPDQWHAVKSSLVGYEPVRKPLREILGVIVSLDNSGIEPSAYQVRAGCASEAARAVAEAAIGSAPTRYASGHVKALLGARRAFDIRAALRGQLDGGDLDVAEIERAIRQYRESGETKGVGFRELLGETLAYLQSVHEGQVGIPTGLHCIDSRIGGLQPQRLVVVAARPAVGKTALTMQFALHASRIGHRVGICSLEMGSHELGVRAMSHEYRINMSELFRAEESALHSLTGKMAQNPLAKRPVFFNTDQYRLDEVINQIQVWRSRDKIEMAVVDHIGLVEVPGSKSANDRISEITRSLKKLTKDLDIPIIAVSQLNRCNARDSRKPLLSDLRDSGSIEQDCDIAIFLHEEESLDDHSNDRYWIGLLKNRLGPAGWINARVNFAKHIQRFEEVDNHYGEEY